MTAAPGPQQPDELRRVSLSDAHDDYDGDDHDRQHGWFIEGCDECQRRADYLEANRPVAPSAQLDECSAVCDRMACEWCPGHDRHEATAQWLYKAVIARQNKVPADDLTPWSELTKDQRNGWRAWADELIPIVLYGIPIPAQPVRDTGEGRRQ